MMFGDINFSVIAFGFLLVAMIITVIIGVIKNKHAPLEAMKRWFTFPETEGATIFDWTNSEPSLKSPMKTRHVIFEVMIFMLGSATIILSMEYISIQWKLLLTYPLLLVWLVVFQRGVLKESIKLCYLKKPKTPPKDHQWVTILTFALIGILILGIFNILVSWSPFLVRTPAKSSWFYIYYSCIQAPIVEELYFRGFLYSRMKHWNQSTRKLSQNQFYLVEAFCSALLFAFWHVFSFMVLYSAFFVGLFLSFLRNEWGESILLGLLIHSLYNFIAMPWIV